MIPNAVSDLGYFRRLGSIMTPPMKFLPVIFAIVAAVWADVGSGASPDVLPRIACPDDRYKPCGECGVSIASDRVARWVLGAD